MVEGQVNLRDAVARTIEFTEPGRARLPAQRRTSPRCWSARAAGTWWSSTCWWTASRSSGALVRLRRSTSSTTPARCWRAAARPYFYLPKLESHLEARLWNDVFVLAAGRARVPARHDQRHGARSRHPGRVRDGRDPLRAARALRRPERRPLGLHLQHHQEVPRPARIRAARPRAGHDDRALHARLHRAAGEDVPPPRRPRHGWHGRVHPEPPRPGGRPSAPWRGARGQDRESGDGFDGTWVAHPTWCRWRTRSSTRSWATAPTRSSASATTSRRRRELLDRATPGRDHRGRAARQRQRGHPVHRVVAARQGRRGNLQPDGGRGDGGDLALAGLAVDPPRRPAGRRPHVTRELVRELARGARAHPCRGRRRRVFESEGRPRVARAVRGGGADAAFVEFLTLPALELLEG